MTFEEIQELIKLINETDLTEFTMKDGDFEMSIRTNKDEKIKEQLKEQLLSTPAPPHMVQLAPSYVPPPAPTAAAPTPPPAAASEPAPAKTEEEQEDAKEYYALKSPIVGTFYRSSSPEKPPYAKVGDTIEKGAVVCIVEAMKLFNEIESEVSGKIVKVMIEDAQPVEYDQVLYLIDLNP